MKKIFLKSIKKPENPYNVDLEVSKCQQGNRIPCCGFSVDQPEIYNPKSEIKINAS